MARLVQTIIKQVVEGMPTSDGASVKLERVLGQPSRRQL